MNRLIIALASTAVFFSAPGNAAGAAETPKGKYFQRAVLVIFENNDYGTASQQPFFKKLASQGASFTAFKAQARPSQPNYFALTSGSIHGVTKNANVDLDVRNIADLLEAKGLTWKAYVEGYPGNCFTGARHGGYGRKHNPFISYTGIRKDKARCARIVNASEFDKDARSGSLPHYAFYVPDDKNSAHDTDVAYADKFHAGKFSKFVDDPKLMKDTIFISTFDESAGGKDNHIYTSIVGPGVKSVIVKEETTLYSLMRLIEENWDLGDLGLEDAKAPRIKDIWK